MITMSKNDIITLFILLILIGAALYARMGSYSEDSLQTMADPYFYARLAELTIENDFVVPEWDEQSHALPGRPFNRWNGWTYTIVFVFLFTGNLMVALNLAPLLMAVVAGVFAYLLGEMLTKSKKGGLLTAVLILFAPSFLLISKAGYSDTDALVVALSLGSIYALLKCKQVFAEEWINTTKFYFWLAFAVLVNVFFIYSWIAGFYPLILFSGFMVILIIRDLIKKQKRSAKWNIVFLIVILASINIISQIMGVGNVISFAIERLGWFTGAMLVNISVAEMIPIDFINGFWTIAFKVDVISFLATLLLFIPYTLYRLAKKKLTENELLLALWLGLGLAFVSTGARFTLLLSIVVILAGSYIIFKMLKYLCERLKEYEQGTNMIKSAVCVMVAVSIMFSLAYTYPGPVSGNWASAMDYLNENADKDSLIFTWWDPNHYIAYETGMLTLNDGAHCPEYECTVYSHNDRIQDMGRIFITNNETEAVGLMRKYAEFSDENCLKTQADFPATFNTESCKSPKETYFIVSSDLIFKFRWLSYFGGLKDNLYRFSGDVEDFYHNPGVCVIGPGVGVSCPLHLMQDRDKFLISTGLFEVLEKENRTLPIFEVIGPYGAPSTFFIVDHLVAMDNYFNYEDRNPGTPHLHGMLILYSFGNLNLYIPPELLDSIFMRTLFYEGVDLEHFELAYSNPEVKIYRVIF